MFVISNVTIIDKESPEILIKRTRQKNTRKGNAIETYHDVQTRYFCKEGDLIEIITKNAGEWCIVVIAKNKQGKTFPINWKDLKTSKFSLE